MLVKGLAGSTEDAYKLNLHLRDCLRSLVRRVASTIILYGIEKK